MSHNIAGGFSDRKLQLNDAVLGERGRRKSPAEASRELPHEYQLAQCARDLKLRVPKGGGCLRFNPDGNAGEIISEGLRVRELDCRRLNPRKQFLRLEFSVGGYQLDQPVSAKKFAGFILCFGQSVRVEEEHIAG